MFTRKPIQTLVLVAVAASACALGCRKPPDPERYGEIITEVPERLNKPFPLPELENPPENGKDTAK